MSAPSPESARRAGRGARIAVLGVIAVVVLGALVVGGRTALDVWRGAQPAEVGDCLEAADDPGGTGDTGRRARRAHDGPPEPRVVDCGDADAVHAVLGEIPADADPTACLDVAGAAVAVESGEPAPRILCAGPVGADPALSVNTVGPGDCIVVDGEDARRADCADPGAARVLGVLEGGSAVPTIFDGRTAPCVDAGFDGAEAVFTWNLDTHHASRVSFDRGLCLAGEGATR